MTGPKYERDEILTCLHEPNLNVIYMYCHAIGGTGSSVRIPELRFQAPGEGSPGIITPDELAYRLKWLCSPLVFLNGCGTVGYSPEALSPFLKKLVDDRGAAGLIGTEVPVWEPLATEVAVGFLDAFLNGTPAGKALLERGGRFWTIQPARIGLHPVRSGGSGSYAGRAAKCGRDGEKFACSKIAH